MKKSDEQSRMMALIVKGNPDDLFCPRQGPVVDTFHPLSAEQPVVSSNSAGKTLRTVLLSENKLMGCAMQVSVRKEEGT